MQLVPYLRGAFAEYKRSGIPPFRALIMDSPEDAALTDVDDQYIIGDRMMVAPLFAGEAERTVVFPEGQWHDFWTGSFVTSKRLTLQRSTEKIPVYVKTGSVFPWAGVGQHAETGEARKWAVRVYGDGHLPWTMPAALGGLQLRWDPVAGRGEARNNSSGQSAIEITAWQHFG